MTSKSEKVIKLPESVAQGMIEVLGENSRLAGQSSEMLITLSEKVIDLPTRRMFVILAAVGGFGIATSVVLSVIALAVAVS